MFKNTLIKQAAEEFVQSIMAQGETIDEAAITQSLEKFGEILAESIRADMSTSRNDVAALAGRKQHVLTNEERKFYEALIAAGKSDKPTQALTDLIPGGMPQTIIEDVYREVQDTHPLLQAVNYINVGYLTRWILADNAAQTAVWGAINSTITQAIETAFRTVEFTQNKLSAYAEIEKDMLDLGPAFIDAYVRRFLAESISIGLETAIIDGTGKNQPIGLDRVVGANAVVTDGVYSTKTPIDLTSFAPEDYGAILSLLAKTELGNPRKFEKVCLVCSMEDYLVKVMPSSTVLTANGNYVSNVFPFPTDPIISNYVPKRFGEDSEDHHYGILFVPGEYDVLVGANKSGAIEFSDDFKFLEDKRVLKTKMYATGQAKDNTSAIIINMDELEPAYIYVKDMTDPQP